MYLSHSEMEEFTSEDTAFASKRLVQQGFKSYAVFLKAIYQKMSLIFVVQLPINIMRILSVQVAAKIPAKLFILTEQR